MKRILSLLVLIIISIITLFAYKDDSLLVVVGESLSIVEYKNLEDSECVYLNNSYEEVVKEIGVEIVNQFEIDGRIITEGYVPSLSKSINVDNRKINIQMSEIGGFVVVGYPLIKNSF